jgi:hypothetical protein
VATSGKPTILIDTMSNLVLICEEGRLGNQLFLLSYANKVAGASGAVVGFGFNQFRNFFYFNRRSLFLASPRWMGFYYKTLIKILRRLSRYKVIGEINENYTTTAGRKYFLGEVNIRPGFLNVIWINEGYFQREDFFDKRSQDNLFMPKWPVSSENQDCILLHVRGGDYKDLVYFGQKDVSLPALYYQTAVKLLRNRCGDLHVKVVGDDPLQTQLVANQIPNSMICSSSEETDFQALVSASKVVISNSTFAWWGAYLNGTNKEIVAPNHWIGWKAKTTYPPGILNFSTRDWQIIEVDGKRI